jgi:hypothetical protein
MVMAIAERGFLFGGGLFAGFGDSGLVTGSGVVILVLTAVLILEVIQLCLDQTSLLVV